MKSFLDTLKALPAALQAARSGHIVVSSIVIDDGSSRTEIRPGWWQLTCGQHNVRGEATATEAAVLASHDMDGDLIYVSAFHD